MLKILRQIQENNQQELHEEKRTATVTTPHNETVREPVNESRSSLNKGSGETENSLQGLMSLGSRCLKRGSTEQRIRYAERTLYIC